MSLLLSQTPTFFIDRCLGKKLATMLRAQGHTIELHDSHFAKDVDWLPPVGQRGWVVLTKDERIAKRIKKPSPWGMAGTISKSGLL